MIDPMKVVRGRYACPLETWHVSRIKVHLPATCSSEAKQRTLCCRTQTQSVVLVDSATAADQMQISLQINSCARMKKLA